MDDGHETGHDEECGHEAIEILLKQLAGHNDVDGLVAAAETSLAQFGSHTDVAARRIVAKSLYFAARALAMNGRPDKAVWYANELQLRAVSDNDVEVLVDFGECQFGISSTLLE